MSVVAEGRWRPLLTVMVLLGVCACGSTTSPARATQSSPTTALLTAVTRTVGQSLHADVAMDVTLTGTQSLTAHLTMQLTEESPSRISVTLNEDFLGATATQVFVAYDGTLYESRSGGQTFTSLPTEAPLSDTYDQADALDAIRAAFNVTDQGSEVTDGQNVEEYSGPLNKAKLAAVVRSRLQKLGVNTADLQQALNSLTGSVDATLDGDGRLVTEDVTFDTTIRCACNGTLEIHEDVHAHFYDYGTTMTVSRPPG